MALSTTKLTDVGLLIMRLGLGGAFIAHGLPKVQAGPHTPRFGWHDIGSAGLGALGVQSANDTLSVVFGAIAAFSECGGGILLILGFFFRPAAFLMFATMAVAVRVHMSGGDDFNGWNNAFHCAVAFLGLLFTGPGSYALRRK